jgi:hypothetical protein
MGYFGMIVNILMLNKKPLLNTLAKNLVTFTINHMNIQYAIKLR